MYINTNLTSNNCISYVNSYQYYLTGSILSYNTSCNQTVFYGGAYLDAYTGGENVVEIVGLNNSTIAFIGLNSTNVVNIGYIEYDNVSGFIGQVDLAQLFLEGSDIVENTPVIIYGNSTNIEVSPSISLSNVNSYTGILQVGSYGLPIQYIDNNFYGLMDILVSYESSSNIQTWVTLEGVNNQIVITLNGNPTYADANQIYDEYVAQFLTRYQISAGNVNTSNLSVALTSNDKSLVYENLNKGTVLAVDIGLRNNFSILYSGNKIVIFGGYLNGQLTDELLVIDPYSYELDATIHTGIFLNNPIVIQLGHLMLIYGGENQSNQPNYNAYLIDIGNLDRASSSYNYTGNYQVTPPPTYVQVTTIENTVYQLPYANNYYTAYSPNQQSTYLFLFENGTIISYKLNLQGVNVIDLGQSFSPISDLTTFSAVTTEDGNYYCSYIDSNNHFKLYFYNVSNNTITDITQSYFTNLPYTYLETLVNQICRIISPPNQVINTTLINQVTEILDNLNSSYIFINATLDQNVTGLIINEGILGDPNTISLISNNTVNLSDVIVNITTTGNYNLDTRTENEYKALFSFIFYILTGMQFDTDNISLMYSYVTYNNNQLLNIINNLIICRLYYNQDSYCNINSLLPYNIAQIINNLNYVTFDNLLALSSNYILSLAPVPGNFPILTVSSKSNICSSTTYQKFMGNISPSCGFIVDVNETGTVVYSVSLILSISNMVATSSNVEYTPTTSSARPFRDIALGYPNTAQIGTRNFDMENNLPLLPVANSLDEISYWLQTFSPDNYNAIVNNPNKSDILYDILSSLSKITSNVDFSLLYAPQALSNIENVVNLFKPIYARPVYIIPTIEVTDNIGEWIAMGDSVFTNYYKQFWDTLSLNDNPMYYLYQSATDNETMSDIEVIQVTATEEYSISPTGNLSEVVAYCSM